MWQSKTFSRRRLWCSSVCFNVWCQGCSLTRCIHALLWRKDAFQSYLSSALPSLTEYVIPGLWSNERDLSVVVFVVTLLQRWSSLRSVYSQICSVLQWPTFVLSSSTVGGKDAITNQTRTATEERIPPLRPNSLLQFNSNLIWYQIKHIYPQDPDFYLEQHQILLSHRHQRPKYTQSIHYSLRNSWKC